MWLQLRTVELHESISWIKKFGMTEWRKDTDGFQAKFNLQVSGSRSELAGMVKVHVERQKASVSQILER